MSRGSGGAFFKKFAVKEKISMMSYHAMTILAFGLSMLIIIIIGFEEACKRLPSVPLRVQFRQGSTDQVNRYQLANITKMYI